MAYHNGCGFKLLVQHQNAWRDLSRALRHFPASLLAYEVLNEPVADDPEDWNKLFAKCYTMLRADEPDRVLVVEDNAINRKVIESLLNRLGMSISHAGDGQAAVDAVTSGEAMPDVILMDVQMPVMDGLQATRLIRAWERQSGHALPVPIVAMTANAFESDRLECIAAGMNEFLSKPYWFEELEALLAKLLPTDPATSGAGDAGAPAS